MKKIALLFVFFCTTIAFAQDSTEYLSLKWPDQWKQETQVSGQVTFTELIPAGETLEKWTEIGNMTSIQGAKISMDQAMALMFEQSKKEAPKAKLTLIEKDDNAENPWIIFTIESPNFANDNVPESQLWYIVQGKNALYTNFRAVKKAKLPAKLKEEWIKFFKAAQVAYR
jgi:hypothetical protein